MQASFVLAGKAFFTVNNDKGEHYTFKMVKVEANEQWPEAFFLSYLIGQDNESDYANIGKFIPNTGEIRLTRKSQLTEESKPYKVAKWALKKVFANESFPEGYACRHAGRCGRCGRMLTNPLSLDVEYGPECIKRMEGE